jgi:hypothetical protein
MWLLRRIQQTASAASLLPAVALMVVISGCGSSPLSAPASTNNQATQQQKAQAAFSAMNQCLGKEGFRMVGAPSDEQGANSNVITNNAADKQMRDDPSYKKAYDKCAASTGFNQSVNGGNNQQPSAQDIQNNNEKILKVYTCLRQKGWTLADPTKDAQGSLTPPAPPLSAQQDQTRMGQFTNDLTSCMAANGMTAVSGRN